MELLTALLTALFFWIFVYYCLTDSLRRARQAAGRPLLVVKCPRWLGYFNRVSVVLSAVVALGILVIMPRDIPPFPGSGFLLAMMIFSVFMLVFASALVTQLLLTVLELHERGIIRYCSRRTILPWKGINYCEWTAKPGTLRIRRHRKWFSERYRIDPEQMREVTAVLVKHVEVRDATGTIPEDELRRPEAASESSGEPAEAAPARFQFTLTALFLLLLVASAAFSWFGIRYRRDQCQTDALVRLCRFKPAISWSLLGSLQLDFSQCVKRPADADLADLAHFYELGTLDLSGCPVTDEGLAHIEHLTGLGSLNLQGTQITGTGLKHLENLSGLWGLTLRNTAVTDAGLKYLHRLSRLGYIDLSNTAVTPAGVAELQRALPDATIIHD